MCVYRADYVWAFGDSGAPVFAPYSGNNVTFAGINFGAMGDRPVFSKSSRVVADLGSGLNLGVSDIVARRGDGRTIALPAVSGR